MGASWPFFASHALVAMSMMGLQVYSYLWVYYVRTYNVYTVHTGTYGTLHCKY